MSITSLLANCRTECSRLEPLWSSTSPAQAVFCLFLDAGLNLDYSSVSVAKDGRL